MSLVESRDGKRQLDALVKNSDIVNDSPASWKLVYCLRFGHTCFEET